MLIGRENADIALHDPEVSGRHAEVRLSGASLEIEDLGSTNGTFVNGQRIEGERQLGPGDVVRVGTTELALDAPAGAPAGVAAGAGGTKISQRPDLPSTGAADTSVEPTPGPGQPTPARGPVETWSPSPAGIEAGTSAPTPPQGGAYVPPAAAAYTPPTGGGYPPPQGGQGAPGGPPAGGQGAPSGPPAGGQGAPGGPPPGASPGGGGGYTPPPSTPGYGSGPSYGSGGYGGAGATGGSGKSKAPLIIGLVIGLIVVGALVALFLWPGFLVESDEDKIREVVTEFGETLNDPAVCELVTQAYLEEISGETGEAAVEACETDLAEEPIDIEVKSIDVNGDNATVEAEADGEDGTLELEKQDGEWLISGGS